MSALGLVQFALHASFAVVSMDPRVLVPHLVAWLQDLVLLLIVASAGGALVARAESSFRRPAKAAFLGALVAFGVVLAAYPRMLQSSLAFPVNLFLTDLGTASVFVREYAGLRVLWPAVIALGAGIVAPRLAFLRLPHRRTVIATLVAIAIPTLLVQAPNPIVFSIQDTLLGSVLGGGREVPRLVPGVPRDQAAIANTTSPLEASGSSEYDHVLLVVLEGITATSPTSRDGFRWVRAAWSPPPRTELPFR